MDIETPPLRDRPGDIPVLVNEFLADISARQGRPAPALDASAIAALATYRFPGSARELTHALERAVAVSRGGVIRLEHRRVLERTSGHRGRAAALLGIFRKALWLRLRGDDGAEKPEPEDDAS